MSGGASIAVDKSMSAQSNSGCEARAPARQWCVSMCLTTNGEYTKLPSWLQDIVIRIGCPTGKARKVHKPHLAPPKRVLAVDETPDNPRVTTHANNRLLRYQSAGLNDSGCRIWERDRAATSLVAKRLQFRVLPGALIGKDNRGRKRMTSASRLSTRPSSGSSTFTLGCHRGHALCHDLPPSALS